MQDVGPVDWFVFSPCGVLEINIENRRNHGVTFAGNGLVGQPGGKSSSVADRYEMERGKEDLLILVLEIEVT